MDRNRQGNSGIDYTMDASQVITHIRKKKGLSQTDFAKLVGLTQASLSHIESSRKKPNPGTIAKICTALDIPESLFNFLLTPASEFTGAAKERYQVLGEEMKEMILAAI